MQCRREHFLGWLYCIHVFVVYDFFMLLVFTVKEIVTGVVITVMVSSEQVPLYRWSSVTFDPSLRHISP
jgi:hypothetical protein